MLTHDVSVDADRGVVVKRFVGADRGEPAREWRALTLLAEHAPGLAPEPLTAELTASPAVIEMSLLPGEPLGGRPLTQDQESAVIRAVSQLWQAVPVGRVTPLPGEDTPHAQAELARAVTAMAARTDDRDDDTVVRKARAAGLDWMSWGADLSVLRAGDPPGAGHPALPRVFGQGDANLANFLWDGELVRIVDFEDSGISDRAFELAIFVEHLSAWSDAGLAGQRFIGAFELTIAERSRLADWRRLAALYWLLRLRPGGDAEERNPPGTRRRQAERLLALL
ncbi:MAG: aminoglycoside phosphotransferase family protein [Streptosporangiaceae bacterium]